MLTLFSTLIVFGILVTLHEWGHFIVAKKKGVKVEKFSIGFGPVLFKYTWHDTEYLISLFPLGGYVKMAGDDPDDENTKGEDFEFLSKSPWEKIQIAIAGPFLNYVFALIIFIGLFLFGSPTATTEIGGFIENSPAQIAGLQKGDIITKINNQKVELWEQLLKNIQSVKNNKLNIEYKRDNKLNKIIVLAKKEELKDVFGEKKQRFIMGIKPSAKMIKQKYGLGKSISMGINKLYFISFLTYKSLWKIITGKMSFKKSMTGPLGIVFITGETAKKGLVHLIHLMGLLSAALALFNFLPIPVLDGGHIAMSLFEMITKKQLSLKFQDIVNKIGVTLLISLMIFVFYNDFVKFKIFGKAKTMIKNITTKIR